MKHTVQRLTAATTLALLALAPAVDAGAAGKKPVTKKVAIHDNYYEPAKLTVPVDSTIVWKWPAVTGDSHDVTLEKGPKGAKRFQSPVAAAAFTYKRKLTVPGRYHVVCTLHEEMTMDILVRR
ncbi:MAG TPA: plastocyanin/azurin family copper-binding protein [Capillimicrobium sp.]|nr:plastocyanin/azurin family copper-binding protein [Capillimicrobium sp.]